MSFRILLIIIGVSFLWATGSYSDNIRFEPIPVDLDPAQRAVIQIVQDELGFMWFATQGGLIKYDGYKNTIYRFSPNDPQSISSNFISCLCKSQFGYIWVGTIDGGLNKYDPVTETFTRYRNRPGDPGSIADNLVYSLYEDQSGGLWVGTKNGLSWLPADKSKSNTDSSEFLNFRPTEDLSGSDMLDQIWSIYEQSDHTIWVGTLQGNVLRFDRKTRKFSNDISEKRPFTELGFEIYDDWNAQLRGPVVTINAFPSDGDSLLTITGRRFIYKYNTRKNKIYDFCPHLNQEFLPKYKRVESATDRLINATLIDRRENLWVATNDGVFLHRSDGGPDAVFKIDRSDPSALSSSNILSQYQDNQGLIWFALSGGKGIHIYNPESSRYEVLRINLDGDVNLSAIYVDPLQDGRFIWLGAHSRGLIRYDRWEKQSRLYSIQTNRKISFIKEEAGNPNILWIGTIGNGIYRFDKRSKTFSQHVYFKNLSSRDPRVPIQSTGYVTSMVFDSSGIAWLGGLRGLYRYDLQTDEYCGYLNDPDNPASLRANTVSALCPESGSGKNNFWVGTRNGGLHLFDTQRGEFQHFNLYYSDGFTEADIPYICHVMESHSGDVYVATPQGLFCRQRGSERFCQMLDPGGKLAEDIYAVTEDGRGRLWLSTRAGIYGYDPGNQQIIEYEGTFDRYGYFQDNRGELFFTAGNTVVAFEPDSIQSGVYQAPVVLTDFQIYYKSIKPGSAKESPLRQSISMTKEIDLTYHQSIFSFEFAILNFASPEKNRYAFQMSGVDPDWIFTEASRRFATYTNLDPGEYIFRVKGSDSQGYWNEKITSIRVHILPPWWATSWAYFMYIVTLLLICFFLRQYDIRRQRLKQALNLEHEHAQKLEEVDRLKSRFFTNITHEFRTPLTLIKGPVKQLLDGQFTGNLKEQYQIILRSSDRLLNLINQILDLAKLEAGHIQLRVIPLNLIKLLKGIVGTFSSLADTKKIKLRLITKINAVSAYQDQDKVEKILLNLLSNAFKFTPEKGCITVILENGNSLGNQQSAFFEDKKLDFANKIRRRKRARISGKQDEPTGVVIRVINSGPGIARDRINQVFDRFYQVDESDNQNNAGSGVGLALTKELVNLCRGEITVDSIQGKETCFRLWLPVRRSSFKPDEVFTESVSDGRLGDYRATILKDTTDNAITTKKQRPLRKGLPHLLIVEDNRDVMNYISSILKNDYRLALAENGRIGFDETLKKFPDLIISDVIMPEMDGFSFCQKIKSDQRTNHIPIILLTARMDIKSKITGLDLGADAYLGKPFDATELRACIENLLLQRQRLREHFQKYPVIPPSKEIISSMDEDFINQVYRLIEKNIGDVSFNVEKFAIEIGMSRTHLTRKLMALTGHSTVDLLRTTRLRKAAELLQNHSNRVSEIAWQAGFDNPSYFTKCFRHEFGVNPSCYAKKFMHGNRSKPIKYG